MTTEPLTKAARLAIGGAVAPVVRRQAAAPRRVTLVDKDGKPTGQTTAVEVAKAMLARAEIEFSVQEGKRPEWVNCKTCGAPVKVKYKGYPPRRCVECKKRPLGACADCGVGVSISTTQRASKAGRPARCKACLRRHVSATARGRSPRDRSLPPQGPSARREEIFRAFLVHRTLSATARALGVSRQVVRFHVRRARLSEAA